MIISIGLIVLLAIVGVSIQNNLNDKTDNANIEANLNTIKNSIISYYEENKSTPLPQGNLKYYKSDTSYAHDESDSAYGVSGFIGENTLSKKYLAMPPKDPRTKYYYAYAKTLTGGDNGAFQISGILKNGDNYTSLVLQNRTKVTKTMFNLIREYNGPGFVEDKSTIHFPYNPIDKILTAKIYDFSGSIAINSSINKYTNDSIKFAGYTTNTGILLSVDLMKGDKIKVATGSLATIYFSDGSMSKLGNTTSNTELSLAEMSYKKDNTLGTKIRLVLNIGTIWTSASKLGTDSEFETYTDDTIAAVRGTIYGMTNYANTASGTNVTLVRGKIEVDKISGTSTDDLIGKLANNESVEKTPISLPGTADMGIIEVIYGGTPKGLDVYAPYPTGTERQVKSNTGSLNLLPISSDEKTDLLNGIIDANANPDIDIDPQFTKINSGTISISIKASKLKAFDSLCINNYYCKEKNDLLPLVGDNYILTGGTLLNQETIPAGTNSISTGLINIYKASSGALNIKAKKKLSDGTFIYSKEIKKLISINLQEGFLGKKGEKEVVFGGEKVENSLYKRGYDLVAYAPYNKSGDLKMYTGSTGYVTASGGLTQISNDIVYYTGTNSFTGKVTGQITSDFYTLSTLVTQNSLGFTFSTGTNSIVNFNQTIGVFLDNTGTDTNTKDFLKYNITNLLSGSTDFAVEMSVRGGALMRTSGPYYLFSLSGRLNLKLDTNGNLALYANSNSTGAITSLLNTNDFYKVQFIINASNDSVKIISSAGTTISTITATNQYTGALNDLYVGSKFDGGYQWNDIIDYVKIYRKN